MTKEDRLIILLESITGKGGEERKFQSWKENLGSNYLAERIVWETGGIQNSQEHWLENSSAESRRLYKMADL